MYFEQTIIRGNRQLRNDEYSPNEELGLHLRAHDRVSGGEDWFDISKLTEKEVKTIKSLCKSKIEKDIFKNLKAGDSIDILLHFCVYVKRENE